MVQVLNMEAKDITDSYEFQGQTEPSLSLEVRAQVTGTLLEKCFVEGRPVKKGDVLFRIDPKTYQIALSQAEAQRDEVQARCLTATKEQERAEQLLKSGVLSRREYDQAIETSSTGQSALKAAEAAVQQAKTNLEYCTIVADMDGQVGRTLLDQGALISSPQQTLTTILRLDPMYVNFKISETQYLRVRRDVAEGRIQRIEGKERFRAQLSFSDGSQYGQDGLIDFADARLDPQTATLPVRAEFPNPGPDRALLAGQFVRVCISSGIRKNAITLPERAVMQGTAGPTLFIVNSEDKIESRPVRGRTLGKGLWLAEEGVQGGDRVVIEGLQKVAPGQAVQTEPFVLSKEMGSP
jgi:membrane fusion protein (multidrug efflux system)